MGDSKGKKQKTKLKNQAEAKAKNQAEARAKNQVAGKRIVK